MKPRKSTAEKKRMLAAILAIILALSMLLSIAIPFFAYGQSIQADGSIEITAQVGFSQMSKLGKPTPVQIQIVNNGAPVDDGQIEIKTYLEKDSGMNRADSGKDYMLYTYPLALSAGESREIYLELQMPSIQRSLTIDYVDKRGNSLCSTSAPLSMLKQDDIFVGVFSDAPEYLNYLRDMQIPDVYSDTHALIKLKERAIFLDANQFPATSNAISNFDILIINNFNTVQFKADQLLLLKSFIQNGGVLILGSGENADKVFSGLGEVTDAQPLKSVQIDTFAQLTGQYGFEFAKDALLTVTEFKGSQLTPLLLEGDTQLAGAQSLGNGVIVIMHFDLGSAAFSSYAKAAEILSDVIAKTGGRWPQNDFDYELKEKTIADDSYYRVSKEYLGFIEQADTGIISVLLIVILIYALSIVSFLYAYLKKKGILEKGWVVIPAISLGLVLIITLISTRSYYKNPIVKSVSIITDKQGGEIKSVHHYLGAYSPKNGAIHLQSQDIDYLSPRDIKFYDESRNKAIMETTFGNGTDIKVNEYASWDKVVFQGNDVIVSDGGIENDLVFQYDLLTGSVTNNTGYDLKNASILLKDSCYFLGDFAHGETLAVHLNTSSRKQSVLELIRVHYTGVDDGIKYGLGDMIDKKEISLSEAFVLLGEYEIYEAFFKEIVQSETGSPEAYPVYIVGFVENDYNESDFMINNKKPTVNQLTFYISENKFNLYEMPEFIIPYDLIYAEFVDESHISYETKSGKLMPYLNQGTYELFFQLPEDIRIDEIQMYWEIDSEDIEVAHLYNASEDIWEVLDDTFHETSLKQHCIDSIGQIRLMVTTKDTYLNIPTIRVKGGH